MRLITVHFDDVILDEGDRDFRLAHRRAIKLEQRFAPAYCLEIRILHVEHAVIGEQVRDRLAFAVRDVPAIAGGQLLDLVAILQLLNSLFD